MELALFEPRAPQVEEIWRSLEPRARPAYFLTWGWIENWIACLPPDAVPKLAVLSSDRGPVAAFFLATRRHVRHHVLPTRTMFFNATGVPHVDALCLEHNGMLAPRDARIALADLLRLLPDGWDELRLEALAPDAFLDLDPGPDHRVRIEREVAAPFVDLEAVRTAGGGYLSLLGANTRSQLRRGRRRLGEHTLEVATDVRQALAIFDELVALHTASWRDRGEPGAFADPWFVRVHRRLIARRFGEGEILLVRLRAGDATAGCGYNLVSAGRVLFYQSGLARFDDTAIKPGYLLHAAAIEHAAAAGHAVYDFLAGDSQYKRTLSTGSISMVWACVQRRLARFAVEDRLRRWKRELDAWRAAHVAQGK